MSQASHFDMGAVAGRCVLCAKMFVFLIYALVIQIKVPCVFQSVFRGFVSLEMFGFVVCHTALRFHV